MKYFLDTEFLEGPKNIKVNNEAFVCFAIAFIITGIIGFCLNKMSIESSLTTLLTGFTYLFFRNTKIKTKPTIDLISIGIVAEDGREYYTISKDFNLKEAWNRYQMKQVYGDSRNRYPDGVKEYWIRENVLSQIFDELAYKRAFENDKANRLGIYYNFKALSFNYKNLKKLLKKYGKTNAQIADEIKNFINSEPVKTYGATGGLQLTKESKDNLFRGYLCPEFFAYYADYDWVVFCWIFGRMIDLPKGFPMYCRDLKQMLDEVALKERTILETGEKYFPKNLEHGLTKIKSHPGYPKQENEHNALEDAKWNFELYKFLTKI